MWAYILGSIAGAFVLFCCSAKWIMRKSWEKKKEELEVLKLQLEDLDNLTDELKLQKEEIDRLLDNEFKGDFNFVWRSASKKE